jgi:hypothetical protein
MSDEIRRIFIDSRYRNQTSASNADFSVDLPFEVRVSAGTQVRIDGLLLSHSWPSVETGKNDKLYIKETPAAGGASYNRIVIVPQGTYSIGTLAAALQTQLHTSSFIGDGLYAVTFANNRLEFANSSPTASVLIYGRSVLRGQTSLSLQWTFPGGSYVDSSRIWATIWSAATVVQTLPSPVADICELIGLMDGTLSLTPGVSQQCNHVDLARHKALYLCSNSLPSTSMDLRGNNSIIRQIVVGNAAPGEVVVDQLPSNIAFALFNTDSVLKHLSFQIRDYDGEIATLSGHQISFVLELHRPGDY